MRFLALPLCSLPLLAPSLAQAQGLSSVFATDTTGDSVASLVDLDGNGDFNGLLEATLFYDETLGGIPLSNNSAIGARSDGTVFVTDSTEDIVLELRDGNGSGDANDAGEARIWFDGRVGGNASGVVMTSAQNIFCDGPRRVLIASANSGTGGSDAILLLEDLDGDGDANDLGEAREFAVFLPGAPTGDSLPTDVEVGPDGALYYLETPSGSQISRGIYRLVDLDGSGSIDQPGESTAYFLPPAGAATPFYWTFEIGSDGSFYLEDQGNDLIWRARDADGNDSIDPLSESSVIWQAGTTSTVWDVRLGRDGALYAADAQGTDRLLRMFDANGDGTIDPLGEVAAVYDAALASLAIGNLRGLMLDPRDELSPRAYCTAKLNSLNCLPRIDWSGKPSASAAEGFRIAADLVINQKSGLLFHGFTGTASTPFSGGTLCVQVPIRRTPVRTSGGTPLPASDCSGRFELDMNTFAAGNLGGTPSPLLRQPGTTVHAQWWGRDPGFAAPFNTMLSDAVSFDLLP